MTTQDKMDGLYASHCKMLKEKNKRYGDSALHQLGIFAKDGNASSIKIRLDDKLGRIKNADEIRKNDVSDVIGYLMLLCISQDWLDFDDQID